MRDSLSFLVGRKKVHFRRERVEVVDVQIWAETHISGGGGGAWITEGSGIIRPSHVSSSVAERNRTWLRRDDGTEFDLELGPTTACRAGHALDLVAFDAPWFKGGTYVAASNLTSGRWTLLHSDFKQVLSDRRLLTPKVAIFLATAAVVATLTQAAPLLSFKVSPELQDLREVLEQRLWVVGAGAGALFGLIFCVLAGLVDSWRAYRFERRLIRFVSSA